MRYGIFFQLPVHHDQTDSERYRETVEQCVFAEELGFHSAWLAEAHFHPSFSAVPAPLVLLAAIAGKTKRLRLGTAGVLVPLHHPLRIAEDAATMDVLSDGRLELGVGRGSWSIQFSGLGVSTSESDSRFSEGLEVVRRVLTEHHIAHRGKHWQIPETQLTPRPLQNPVPIRITANSHRSTEWASSRGYPLMTGTVSHPLPDEFESQTEAYRDSFRPGVGGDRPEISMILPLYVGASASEARSEFEPSLKQYLSVIGGDVSWDYARRKMGILGNADNVRAQALQVITEPDLVDFIGWFNVGGRIPHARVMKAMERFAREVRPALDEACAKGHTARSTLSSRYR